MHEMRTIVTDVRCLSVSLSVCLSVCHAAHLGFTVQKNAERIKMLFGVNTLMGQWNIVLDRGPDPPQRCGGGFDAAFAKLLWRLVVGLLDYSVP